MRISDWSSDVCSSDLPPAQETPSDKPEEAKEQTPGTMDHSTMDHSLMTRPAAAEPMKPLPEVTDADRAAAIATEDDHRSEERRAGKERVSTCLTRWSTYH